VGRLRTTPIQEIRHTETHLFKEGILVKGEGGIGKEKETGAEKVDVHPRGAKLRRKISDDDETRVLTVGIWISFRCLQISGSDLGLTTKRLKTCEFKTTSHQRPRGGVKAQKRIKREERGTAVREESNCGGS